MDIGQIRVFYGLLNLAEEIVRLLTGEDNTVVKETPGECVAPSSCPCVSGGWNRSQGHITEPRHQMLIYDRKNEQKILDLTDKMTELLTGEVPIRCQDVAVYFSMEEWEYIEGHKELYTDVVMENNWPLIRDHQGEDLMSVEVVQQCKKGGTCSGVGPGSFSSKSSQFDFPRSVLHKTAALFLTDSSRTRMMTERILNLSLEIIYLLTRENYAFVKKTSRESVIPGSCSQMSEGWSRIQKPMTEPLSHSLMAESNNEQKIIDLTYKMIELLTGEVPIRCQDVAVYFSMEEWEYIEGHKDPYKDIMMEDHQLLTSPDGSSKKNPPEMYCSPLYSQDCSEESHNVPQDYQGEDIIDLKVEIIEREEDLYIGCDEQSVEEEFLPDISTVDNNKLLEGHLLFSPDYGIQDMTQDFPGEIPIALNVPPGLLNTNEFSEIGYQEEPSLDNSCNALPSTYRKGGRGFPCSECGKCFTRKSNLFRHEITHTGQRPFVCKKCGKSYTQKAHLVEHQVFHSGEKPFSCATCGKCFTQRAVLYRHQRIHAGKRLFSCVECGKCFTYKSHLVEHEKFHMREKPYSCSECGESFTKKFMFVNHQSVHTGEKPYMCLECGKCFAKKSVLVDHRRTHTGERPFPCLECGKCFTKKSGLEKHHQTHTGERPFTCSECGKCFSKKSVLIVHQRTHTGERPYACLECGKRFTKKSGLHKHHRTHTGERPFPCSECGKCFFQKSGLVKHQQIHTRGKSVSCFECESGIACIHPERHHEMDTEERPFSCPECGKGFTQKAYLVKHQKIHTGEKPFSCSECGKCFMQKDHLERHQRIHTGEKPYSCSECGKSFTQKKTLVQHHKIHTGEKPFSCSECWKCFTRKCQLEIHQRSHTGEKPFLCLECGKFFVQKWDLVRHQKNHPKRKPSEIGNGGTYEVIHRKDRDERLFLCSECGKCFNMKSGLVTHHKIHSGVKPFSCPECGKCFTRKSPLTMHLKTHTGERPFSCSECGKGFIQRSDLLRHHRIHTRVPNVSVLDGFTIDLLHSEIIVT